MATRKTSLAKRSKKTPYKSAEPTFIASNGWKTAVGAVTVLGVIGFVGGISRLRSMASKVADSNLPETVKKTAEKLGAKAPLREKSAGRSEKRSTEY